MDFRQSLRDAGLAVMLALPTATLASPSTMMWHSRPTVTAPAMQTAAHHSRFNLGR